ncbi:hypothetical protein SMU61_08320, partial [Streptococcus mutans G123]
SGLLFPEPENEIARLSLINFAFKDFKRELSQEQLRG